MTKKSDATSPQSGRENGGNFGQDKESAVKA